MPVPGEGERRSQRAGEGKNEQDGERERVRRGEVTRHEPRQKGNERERRQEPEGEEARGWGGR